MKAKRVIYMALLGLSIASLLGVVSISSESAPERANLKPLPLKQVDSFFLPLDSMTTSGNEYYQFLDTDSGAYLSFLNPLVNSLYTYDLQSRELVKTVPLAKEGPNGMGEFLMSYEIISADTMLFHSYYDRRVYMTDGKGQVIGKYPLYNENIDTYPFTAKGAGIKKVGNKVYLNNGMGCSTDKPQQFNMQMAVDLKDGSLKEFLTLPMAYQTKENSYWPRKFCNLFSAYDVAQGKMVYSFAGDESVEQYDLAESYNSFATGAGYLGRQSAIPMSRYPTDPMSEFKAFLGYNRFGRIHVDPHSGLYMRSFYYETPQEQLDQNMLRTKSTLIVFDKDQNMLGEAELMGTHELFFTKAGMHQVLFNSNIEDSLEIRVFEYNF